MGGAPTTEQDDASPGAVISPCGAYRYMLARPGDLTAERGPAVFLMLNPSTADAAHDDATIARCRGFARAWGCDGIQVVNLYALRTTDPRRLWMHADPVGPDNDAWLVRIAGAAQEVVCAWGAHARPGRVGAVAAMLASHGVRLRCLGVTRDGAPRHPLYLRRHQPLEDWCQAQP